MRIGRRMKDFFGNGQYLRCYAVAIVLSIFGQSALAGSEAVVALKQRLDAIKHYEARFVQTIIDASSDRQQQMMGQLKIKRPKQFRWETEEPFPQQIISNGHRLWLYDIDLEQVTIKTLNQELDRTPAVLLSGNLDGIEANFDVSQRTLAKGEVEFTLKAKQHEANFKQFQFVFKNGQISAMHLFDQLDNLTEILFSNIQQNRALSDAHFTFLPPEGVDVIKEM